MRPAKSPPEEIALGSIESADGATLNHAYEMTRTVTSTQEPGAIDTMTISGLPGEQGQPITGYSYDPATKRLASITVNGQELDLTYLANSNQVSTMSTGALKMVWTPDGSDKSRIIAITATDEVYNAGQFIDESWFNQQDQRSAEWLVDIGPNGLATVNSHYNYTYDPAHGDALTNVTANGVSLYSYGLDGVGNFTSNSGLTSSLGSANSVNQYSNVSYDGSGNIYSGWQIGDWSMYTYDARGDLAEVKPLTSQQGLTKTGKRDREKMACWLSGQPLRAKPDNHEKTHFTAI